MSNFSFISFALIAISCYAVSESTKLLFSDQLVNEATKSVDLPNRIIEQRQNQQNEHRQLSQQQQQQQQLHAVKDEARQKRSQPQSQSKRDFAEFKDLNDIIDDLEDNSVVQSQEFDFENMPPLTYYLLLQKLRQLQSNEPTYRVRTPRLGRSIDFQLLDAMDGIAGGEDNGASRQFVTRVIKKSVPFKPRLGKRAQLCD